ncbi:MAG TPA: ATP-dependent helicase C-terminal domain-containing protein, partial [Verrucomicrobiae bacterium]|nr:ATP-dependent helicase C-terminal domain-containing protein [Verrucomicrobiae bacterium]
WTESNHLNRTERHTPEIQRADLAEIVLLLHSLGIQKAAEFDWLDKPDPLAVERAEKLLQFLGAIGAESVEPDEKQRLDLTEIGRKMLRLPMHPRYSRMLVEAARFGCVKEASLCAALVSGRDLLLRLSRDEKHISTAREEFEVSDQSDFFALMEAFKFAQANGFGVEACRRRGVHAMSAQQVAMTWKQIYEIAGHLPREGAAACSMESLQRCLLTGFVDQLCLRKDQGTLDCILTEGRTGTLMRESVVQKAPLLVVASMREVSGKQGNLTLLGLATAVRLEWLKESFPQHFSEQVEHVFDRTHKRVAAIRLVRFRDLIVAKEFQRELEAKASGLALAQAYVEGLFELPLLTHDLKQFMARVNLVAQAAPELDFPAFDQPALKIALGSAFQGMSLVKEAQGADLRPALLAHLAPEQRGWLDELTPQSLAWPGEKKLKLLYVEGTNEPELQVKLHECFDAKEHPLICEGKIPVKVWLCSPEGKRLQNTVDWPAFKTKEFPKIKAALQKKYPGFNWR